MTCEQRIVRYKGRVQGVGFRYTTRQLAAGFQVAGYVKNLPDGRVELLVEGPLEELEDFLQGVRDRFEGFILEELTDKCPHTGEWNGFEIRHA